MAAISYHGTAFINTEGQPHDEVFFVEDLAHQCGHIIFNTLTLHTTDFLKINKETPMSGLTGVVYDNRSVYGALHGLFTYISILHCLTKCIKLEVFNPSQCVEAFSRIGFFMRKFEIDLNYMNMPQIYTSKGQQIYDGALASFEQVKKEFGADFKDKCYDNQPYIFNYHLFQKINPTF
ncbi:hypothetical protein [Spirosoma utsteinense]|uniref:Uncharacterized protein n=1 Tax=Spirosoma utsteinense TaxID=2585773 RepID=A0ABR6WBM1_9BACT|nr:hypothetical protein [Spirosoma utsteinense]MBC3793941.1 hypothetical protein [Spirosoma utsteinense]